MTIITRCFTCKVILQDSNVFISEGKKTRYCVKCLFTNLFKKCPDDTLSTFFYPNLGIRLTYTLINKSHSGYCSDHEDSDCMKETEHEVFDYYLPRFFSRDNITADNKINIDSENFKMLLDILHITKDVGLCRDCDSNYTINECYIYKKESLRDLMNS